MKFKQLLRIQYTIVASLAVGSTGYGIVVDIPGGSDAPSESLLVGAGETKTVALPEDGVLDYTSVTVEQGGVLKFARNTRNTGVFLLSEGPIIVDGLIDVSGQDGTPTTRGLAGNGGFDGGLPGIGDLPPGPGLGPGGPSAGSMAAHSTNSQRPTDAITYGNKLAVDEVGGSGAGGGAGGGGGGGYILLCSDEEIIINGNIDASGGSGGSGGSIRCVAPTITGAGGSVNVNGGSRRIGPSSYSAGRGFIRYDALDRAGMSVPSYGTVSYGTFMVGRVLPRPSLNIIEVADADPSTVDPIVLPTDSDEERTVVVRAENFGTIVPVQIVVTPLHSPSLPPVDLEIDNTGGGATDAEADVVIPGNTEVRVQVWKR